MTLEITAALQRLGDAEEVTVTALAFPVEGDEEAGLLRFQRLSLVTYD